MENVSSENCCVKVAVHIRPLIADEQQQGCKDCVVVIPGSPQVQINSHCFTFDHVYGSSGSSSSAMFEECVAPLIDGLFQGYNATVLAYGQTGSGKTYTMGTGFKEGHSSGIIPRVMDALFDQIKNPMHQNEFQIRVSFIEILKEEVRDLLDQSLSEKADSFNVSAGRTISLKPPIQIRETSNGVITLAGISEMDVRTRNEMAACLLKGSLNRATGSTNMNNQSSRSHAIFTITLEQMRKLAPVTGACGSTIDDMNDDFLCAKLHLVDLAGSERAKRTGSGGLRFKEGVHINKGLLALGNVISALGDEKKRKEGTHVPYRDSKLTRLLQDSLGGNSRTVMIACISPADINEEETLNTLKYANRARNIQNKPIVNRDPLSSEVQRMRQQLECLQAELRCARGGGSSPDEIQALKKRVSDLEAINENLFIQLQLYRKRCDLLQGSAKDSQESEGTMRAINEFTSSDYHADETIIDDHAHEIPKESDKDWEHALLQDSMGEELKELNILLDKKEREMKSFQGMSTLDLEQHFGKEPMELEEEKRTPKKRADLLSSEIVDHGNMSVAHNGIHLQKLKYLESQFLNQKSKHENQAHLVKQKHRSDDAARKLQEEIQSIKAQKVQLQQKIKHEAEQFRMWKASQEKQVLQLRKEGRRNEYERHKLLALNQRQKLRKAKEAAMATKRLKELLESRKISREPAGIANGNGNSHNTQANEKPSQQWLHDELEVMVNVHEVRVEYEKQKLLRAGLAEELDKLKEGMGVISEAHGNGAKNGFSRESFMPPDQKLAKISTLENMINISSTALLETSSQLAEAEEQERAFASRGRWSQLRSMPDAETMLQYLFNLAVDARCQLKQREMEKEEHREQVKELVDLLQLSEARRKDALRQLQKSREQTLSSALTTPEAMKKVHNSLKHGVEEMLQAQKQLDHSPGIINGSSRETIRFNYSLRKAGKQIPAGRPGKLWRWRRSHHRWLLEFKWRWQKPWSMSELIRQSDHIVPRSTRPLPRRTN